MFVQLFLAKVRAKRRIMLLHFVGAELWLPSQGAACSDAGSAPAEAVWDAGDHRIMRRTFLSDRFATTGEKSGIFFFVFYCPGGGRRHSEEPQSSSSSSEQKDQVCLVPVLGRDGNRKGWKRKCWELQPPND